MMTTTYPTVYLCCDSVHLRCEECGVEWCGLEEQPNCNAGCTSLDAVAQRGGTLGAGDYGAVESSDYDTRRVATSGCGGHYGRTVLVARSAHGAMMLRRGRVRELIERHGLDQDFAARLEPALRIEFGREQDVQAAALAILASDELLTWLDCPPCGSGMWRYIDRHGLGSLVVADVDSGVVHRRSWTHRRHFQRRVSDMSAPRLDSALVAVRRLIAPARARLEEERGYAHTHADPARWGMVDVNPRDEPVMPPGTAHRTRYARRVAVA